MIENAYAILQRHGLPDWGVIFLGVSGVPGLDGRLPASYVEDFAAHELARLSSRDQLFGMVAVLALDAKLSHIELCGQLEAICEFKGIDLHASRRMWRLIAMEYILSELDPDPVYGLIALAGFWDAWNWPADAPLSMQASGTRILPAEYHSQAYFKHVIAEHHEWQATERALLQSSV